MLAKKYKNRIETIGSYKTKKSLKNSLTFKKVENSLTSKIFFFDFGFRKRFLFIYYLRSKMFEKIIFSEI